MIVIVAFVVLHLGIIGLSRKLDSQKWTVTGVGAIVAIAQTIVLVLYLVFMEMPPLR